MQSLRQFLSKKKYHRIPLVFSNTNHFKVSAFLNGIEGDFIVDTGASNSCVGFEAVEKFNLLTENSDVLAAGAGATDMITQLSKKNTITIGHWTKEKIPLVLFDLSHVNSALINHESEAVDGIIGADILKKGKVIIDYERKCMYMK